MSIGILVTHLSELAWTLLVGNIICVSYVMLQKTWNLDGYCWRAIYIFYVKATRVLGHALILLVGNLYLYRRVLGLA